MKIYFDGGAAPNPGPMHIAVIIGNKAYDEKLEYGTNNVAEWTALIWAMQLAISQNIFDVEIYGDSTLIVKQANGEWKIKQQEFKLFKIEFDNLKKKFTNFSLQYKPRNENLAGIHIEKHVL